MPADFMLKSERMNQVQMAKVLLMSKWLFNNHHFFPEKTTINRPRITRTRESVTLGLLMVYAGFSVAAVTASLSSEFNSENQFNSYISSASNIARKPREKRDSSYSGTSGGFSLNKSHTGYDIDYRVTDVRGNTHYHKAEADDKGIVRGMYGYMNMQGLYRVVDYTADKSGFHAKIRTNEPGTDSKNPASVEMVAEQPRALFPGNYDEPAQLHQDKRVRGQSQYEQGTKTINKEDEPPFPKTRTMTGVILQGFKPSSYSDGYPDDEEE
ncbi:unnamed protein product [Larinioides sclopetarius]|uniref:Uncharacterized protein n=1 Tax=Larinioides sclopetarius TaxID=280406 RepID=A0AAV2A7I7_9ARAC